MIILDSIGKELDTDIKYRRIVSLVPSQTEYIIDLIQESTQHKVVGRTKFCIHPAQQVKDIAIVGGTKQVHADKIAALKPDLIVINKEENTQEIEETLSSICPIFTTEIRNLADAFSSMIDIAKLINLEETGTSIVENIKKKISVPTEFKFACYLIWKDPYMTIGGDTFINDMMARSGFINVFSDKERYPTITLDDIAEEAPDYIFLSSEPYPFQEKHISEFESLGIPVEIVDGEMYSWYGTRLIKSWEYFKQLNNKL